MSRSILISDVHGCLAELETLIEKIRLRPTDRLFFLGDLIDKGPDSCGVLKFVLSLKQECSKLEVILGNHEEKFMRWLNHETRRIESGVRNPVLDPNRKMLQLAQSLNQDQIALLRSACVWAPIMGGHAGEPTVIAVHAGIAPNLSSLPPRDQPFGTLPPKERRRFGTMVRVRWVDCHGRVVPSTERGPNDRFWADTYDGRFGLVVYGHHACRNNMLRRSPHAIGIDLGCVGGGSLAAVVFRDDRPQWESVIVPSRNAYFSGHRD